MFLICYFVGWGLPHRFHSIPVGCATCLHTRLFQLRHLDRVFLYIFLCASAPSREILYLCSFVSIRGSYSFFSLCTSVSSVLKLYFIKPQSLILSLNNILCFLIFLLSKYYFKILTCQFCYPV